MTFTQWITQPENQVFLVGAMLMLLGAAVLLALAFPTDRTEEGVNPADVQWNSYTVPRHEWVEWSDTVRHAEALTEVLEAFVTDTVEIPAFDPLATTTELERIDPSVPIFFQIRRPAPFRMDSFTTSWTAERIAEIKEKHDANR